VKAAKMQLDRIDRRILTLLQEESRISIIDLAARVGLSPTPCSRRVRALEQSGIIRKYGALIDLSKVDLNMVVLLSVRLSSHNMADVEAFEAALGQMPEVVEAYMTTGNSEYLLKVATRDLSTYNTFQREKLLSLPMVVRVDSVFALREVKRTPVQF